MEAELNQTVLGRIGDFITTTLLACSNSRIMNNYVVNWGGNLFSFLGNYHLSYGWLQFDSPIKKPYAECEFHFSLHQSTEVRLILE